VNTESYMAPDGPVTRVHDLRKDDHVMVPHFGASRLRSEFHG